MYPGNCTHKKGAFSTPQSFLQFCTSASVNPSYSFGLPVLASPWYHKNPFTLYLIAGATMALYSPAGAFCPLIGPPPPPPPPPRNVTGSYTSPTLKVQVPLRSIESLPATRK